MIKLIRRVGIILGARNETFFTIQEKVYFNYLRYIYPILIAS